MTVLCFGCFRLCSLDTAQCLLLPVWWARCPTELRQTPHRAWEISPKNAFYSSVDKYQALYFTSCVNSNMLGPEKTCLKTIWKMRSFHTGSNPTPFSPFQQKTSGGCKKRCKGALKIYRDCTEVQDCVLYAVFLLGVDKTINQQQGFAVSM